MKILFFGLSSKFIHTLPAGWSLSEYLSFNGISVIEKYHTVNEKYEDLLDAALCDKPDVILFSVYIFNVLTVKKLISDIRLNSTCKIIIGGPEADVDIDADHIVFGEGEKALYELLTKGGERIIFGENLKNLDLIPSPYTEKRLFESKNKLVYYESSRGCPFSCAYCMAGLTGKVRYFSLDRVKSDLSKIVNSGAKTVKFTDRTFNANTARTNEILEFIAEKFSDKKVCFHFEVGGDLFKESTIKILEKLPAGLVQFEAGVQTLNEKSLAAVSRSFDKEKFIDNIKKIISFGNIHVHLDLIAGLPYETLATFEKTFDEVMALRPHKLQLGFLKMLKFTPIRETYDAQFDLLPPYEVRKTPYMSENDLRLLKEIDWIIERLYNSGKFTCTLEKLFEKYKPFEIFRLLNAHFAEKGIRKNSAEYLLYEGVLSFCRSDDIMKEILRFDFLVTNNSRIIPRALRNEYTEEFKRFLSDITPDRYILYDNFSHLPDEKAGNFTVKFDYKYKHPVSNRYRFEILKEK